MSGPSHPQPSLPGDWRHLFVGRKTELDWLISAWQQVKQGRPQFLVLLAETGLGKTRLVQELYRWLQRNEDPSQPDAPQGYWPDAFANYGTNLEVNPQFPPERGVKLANIPWLWWGLRFLRPDHRNQVGARCGLVDYREALTIHTEPIQIARQLKTRGQTAAWTAGSVGANLVQAVPIVGTVVSLAFAAKDLFSLGKSAQGAWEERLALGAPRANTRRSSVWTWNNSPWTISRRFLTQPIRTPPPSP